MKIENLKISEIKPYEKNPRKNDRAVEIVSKSISTYGFKVPVILDKNNVIIAGHTRIKAAEKLGIKEIPCIRADELTDAQVKAFRIMDNKSNEFAEWDLELLKGELNDLEGTAFFELTGFTNEEISSIWDSQTEVKEDIIEVDAYERAKAKTKIQLGEIYLLGNHRLMCGDSTEKSNVDMLMAQNKADLVFTDPPYGMFLDTDFSSMKGIGRGNKYEKVKGDHEDFKPEIITSVLEYFSYCKEIFLWGADYYLELIHNRNSGSLIVWDKMCGEEGPNDAYDKMFGSNFEICWSKTKHKRALARVLWKGIFGLSKEDTKSRVHPTQKPVKLVDWFLTKFSSRNNIVADLYGGSGSTLIACEQLNRKCFMMELDPIYCQVIIDRFIKLKGHEEVYKVNQDGTKTKFKELQIKRK